MQPLPLPEAPVYELEHTNIQRLLHTARLLTGAPVILPAAQIGAVAALFKQAGLHDTPLLALEEVRLADETGASQAPLPPAAPHLNDCAFLMYTSGSTAQPKLVSISHCLALTNLISMVRVNGYTSQDKGLNWLLLHHIAAVMRFLRDLYLGIPTVQVHYSRVLQNPLAWLDLIDAERASLSWAPNFAFARVVERLEHAPGGHAWDLSCLRSLYSSGEVISGPTMLRFAELLQPYGLRPEALHASWGMTETASTVVYSRNYVLDLQSGAERRVRVGLPVPGVSVRIVQEQEDGRETIVPAGVLGSMQVEVRITPGEVSGEDGDCCQALYVGDDRLNEAAYTPDGWLRTGDRALIEDGALVILGRSNDTLILNGVNFAAAEIEHIVAATAGVLPGHVAACMVQPFTAGCPAGWPPGCPAGGLEESQPVDPAALVLGIFYSALAPGDPELASRLRANLARNAGIVPAYLAALPAALFPRSEIGKLQRAHLRDGFNRGDYDAYIETDLQRSAYEPIGVQDLPPRCGLRCSLSCARRGIIAEALGLPGVLPEENFFSLGASSILVAEIAQRLQAAFPGATVSAVEVFRYPTARQMAEYLRSQSRDDHPSADDLPSHVEAGLQRAALRRQARRQAEK